ncbi:helix-turn-helix domain-containing protein [Arcticibacterium luteifluviistationis]|uniref:AraC family transcriptional regulator n=1 Tax=Arcticibacterium luteifluviistationis TaxID=1784714 RepID=A0A2Z4GCS9_9BACT|nr:AraC family transcriptional regulator [Arcticibacterium luteifluviistationis]AWV98835.1 AraC family transcriptional regulator [Arcticibacterium luteifluviistationis]
MQTLKIKNMVCDRCIMSVKQLLDTSGIAYGQIELGRVPLKDKLSEKEQNNLAGKLESLGFELLLDKDYQYVEAVKNAVTKLIYQQENALKKYTISAYIEEEVGKDYKWLSSLFSSKVGDTIEHFVIEQKIERVKELITYDEMTISEISESLHYSSVAHLSNQFKKIVGVTPSNYKTTGKRKQLDKI